VGLGAAVGLLAVSSAALAWAGLPTRIVPASGAMAPSPMLSAPNRLSAVSRAASDYADRTGDATGGAPDVTAIQVTNDPAGTITFQITVLGLPSPETSVGLVIDYDRSLATGDEGDDYFLELDGATSMSYGSRWDGVAWVGWTPSTGRADVVNGVWSVSLGRSDLSSTSEFDFYVYSVKYSGQQQIGSDEADQLLTYALSLGPPPPKPRTYENAPRLPSRIRYVGQSIKHVRLGEKLYSTMRRLGAPRVVAVACWSKFDWPSVVESAGFDIEPAQLSGFWLPRQPRWIHVSPKQCADVQALILSRNANGHRAYALATVLHERVHAEGVSSEAQTECFAVQLVYEFSRELNFVHAKALRLEQLAVRKSRAVAPRGYWNAKRCSDGGSWDLFPEFRNLTY
jgi:hypothetical protein